MSRINALLEVGALVVLLAACGGDESTPAAGGSSGTGGSGGQGGSAGADPQSYLDGTLAEQVAAVDGGEVSCEALVEAYLARIAERDEGFNAFIAMTPDPQMVAAAIDGDTGSGKPLHCGVIVLKDNIDMAALVTSAGSLALADNTVTDDAPLVARLRAEGAMLIGKSNLSEWANFRGYNATSGWSSLGGQTNNGFDPAYNPSGSSSGSAAAVAAGMVAAALGTETDGSLTSPASANGVVGFKPTVGLISRFGIVPISETQDTAGPLTKTVADAARLVTVMAGPDPNDPATSAIPSGLDLDFEGAIEGARLTGARLGVVQNYLGDDSELDALFEAEVARMETAGAITVDVQLPSRSSYANDELTVLLSEFKVGVNAYLASHARSGQPATLADLISFNQSNATEVMPHFGQELFIAAEQTTGLDDPAYLMAKANAQQAIGTDGIAMVMSADMLDALIAPTMGPVWTTNYNGGDRPSTDIASAPAAVAGGPHISVPMGMVRGLPVGLSIFADRWDDAEVLRLAHTYEQLPR